MLAGTQAVAASANWYRSTILASGWTGRSQKKLSAKSCPTAAAYPPGCAAMARSAKRSASRLVRAENRPPGSARRGELPSQMYSEAAIRGPAGGHSTRSAHAALITAQSANDIVRDHRYTPSLLVRLNWCSCTLNQAL